MDRYLLLVSWRGAGGGDLPGLTVANIYNLLKTNCNTSLNANIGEFPACSLAGTSGVKEWYFAIQSICGFYQFCSSDWEDINFELQTDQRKDSIQRIIEECFSNVQNIEEDDNSREPISLKDLYEESAESLHQLADKLPAPGKAMIDVILHSSERDGPRLKDCLPVVGALKHLREWHSAKITIVANKSKTSWQNVANYLSADILAAENIKNSIDSRELWRGKIQIWERKVGALFVLPCSVSRMLIPLPNQLSTKKWKEYMARKPKVINIPEVELKGETCNYYFLVQGNGCGGCKATLIYSASQINGSVTLAETIGRLTTKACEPEAGLSGELLQSLPHVYELQILEREKKLACIQALALNQFLRRQELARQQPTVSPDELTALLSSTRKHFLDLWNASLPNSNHPLAVVKTEGHRITCGVELNVSNPLEWPERSVLHNLENVEKIKQKTRGSEQLLGHKDSQKESATLLDAKELLKYFTPEGLPVGDLQPLRAQKSENAFLLTPELTPRKLRNLPFEKATGCHYHGLEFCLDNKRALERDVVLAELQTRLIRYETQTTCTKEYCPVPCVLSPLPSPAVLSEPGSIPDAESLQKELQMEASRLKRRSKDLDSSYPKRLMKSESSDSLLSQGSGSSGGHYSGAVTRQHLETSSSLSSMAVKQACNPLHKVITQSSSTKQRCAKEPEILKPAKESRSQKHTRMLKEVVTKTLEKNGIAEDHKCFVTCSQRLFEISKFYLKDLKTSRGLFDEMKKAANSNVKQVVEWVLEKTKEK
ncbi:mdm2-binding protein isoform X4 [Tiliqua scincoides]|uniref:mdm2-binding protein isoform X4 n=1 Tax=Tiliqua scincoides TaxID=71010 RepID=UPI0034621A98